MPDAGGCAHARCEKMTRISGVKAWRCRSCGAWFLRLPHASIAYARRAVARDGGHE